MINAVSSFIQANIMQFDIIIDAKASQSPHCFPGYEIDSKSRNTTGRQVCL